MEKENRKKMKNKIAIVSMIASIYIPNMVGALTDNCLIVGKQESNQNYYTQMLCEKVGALNVNSHLIFDQAIVGHKVIMVYALDEHGNKIIRGIL